MDEVLRLFDPAAAVWFSESVGKPTPVQEQGWPAVASGSHVLISAPTGSGKTLCAFLVFIDRFKALAREGELPDELQLLYISPLKALGNDIRENLRRPLDGIAGPELRAAVRTGDTTQSERSRMYKKPPHILITTPESLYLLLTGKNGQNLLRTAKTVILDELHALINDKRGAHLMLSLARLDKLCGSPLQRVGLSATIEPLDLAAEYLAAPDPVKIVAPKMEKSVSLTVVSPLPDMHVLPEGTIWPELARAVYNDCEGARTVIAFLESRAQAEKLAYLVNQIAGEGFARTHHGCVSKEQRLEAEQQLRDGQLRLLCATSSMELGIDVGEVDLVLQIGCPRTVSGTMQRLGRAGHNPGRTSVMRIYPKTAADGLYCGLTARVALDGGIEAATPPMLCLDVLAQHLVSMAAGEDYSVDEVLEMLERAYNFRAVTRETIRALLRMLAGDFEHEQDHPARPRVLYDRIHETVQGDAYSRILALSAGGTIPDLGWFSVHLPDGTRLGELDEEFVFEARIGDKFLLGAFAWRIAELGKDRVIVEPASMEGAQPPFWKRARGGRSYETGLAFGRLLRGFGEAYGSSLLFEALRKAALDDAAAGNAQEFLTRQMRATGCLPSDRTILVEHIQDESGTPLLMVHSVFGRKVNVGLSLLLQEAARRVLGPDIYCFEDDDGILLYPSGEKRDFPENLLQTLRADTARALLTALLPQTPLFQMTFRYNAGRALMMGVRQGKRMPLWLQRLRAAQTLEGVLDHRDHPLVRETRRECLENHWDLPAIEEVLRQIQSGAIAVREMHLEEPSAMSLPLRRQAESQFVYDYHPTPKRAQQITEQDLREIEMLPPAPEQLEKVSTRAKQLMNARQLHALFMAEGDLIAGELDVPLQWLTELANQERACYIEPGLWICAEQAELYRAALEEGDTAAQERIVRRCLRYRGAQTPDSLAERYCWTEEQAAELLEFLVSAGLAKKDGEGLCFHAELYRRAQRETVRQRRQQVETLPPECYAALLCQRMRLSAAPETQLRRAVESLADQPFPPELWERVLLPARVNGYRPEQLDQLLAQGDFYWQLEGDEKPLLAFHNYKDINWNISPVVIARKVSEGDNAKQSTDPSLSGLPRHVAPHSDELSATPNTEAFTADEFTILQELEWRGASFPQALALALGGRSPLEVLFSLAEKGLVRADSFLPVRQWLNREKAKQYPLKRQARGRALTLSTGRWELTRPCLEPTPEERLESAFDRAGLLCRETAGEGWPQALETLRAWEYTGRVRRGYFIRGLSGAQFVRETEFQALTLALRQPQESLLWLNAVDPAQAWGKILTHNTDKVFTCTESTAVALRTGLPVAVLERKGQVLRVFAQEHLEEALQALVRDFTQKRIFSQKNSLTLKEYPAEAVEALEAAGFKRQMMEYVLWRRAI